VYISVQINCELGDLHYILGISEASGSKNGMSMAQYITDWTRCQLEKV
jgi:hypothetical protein